VTITAFGEVDEIAFSGCADKVRAAMGQIKRPISSSTGPAAAFETALQRAYHCPSMMPSPKTRHSKTISYLQFLTSGRSTARSTQPVVLFYNKSVLDSADVAAAKIMDDIMASIPTLAAAGVTPVALAGTDSWTELMWLEYLVDRIGGPKVLEKIESGDSSGWSYPAILKSAKQIKALVDAGAFGTNSGSINYGSSGSSC
jgi:xylobiose transport system substrate-binding protein